MKTPRERESERLLMWRKGALDYGQKSQHDMAIDSIIKPYLFYGLSQKNIVLCEKFAL